MNNEFLGYYWRAEFSMGIIDQFEGDKEILFKEVLYNIKDLEKFSVVSFDDDESYTADLIGKKIITPKKTYKIKGTNPKLIYFRRNSVRMSLGTGEMLDPMVVHHLGIKTNTDEKKVEIFKGLGTRPKKVEFNDVKDKKKLDITK